MNDGVKVLLLGGDGFLGRGLQAELVARGVAFTSLDIGNADLEDCMCIPACIEALQDVTHVAVLASKVGAELFTSKPVEASQCNAKIHQHTLAAVQEAANQFGRPFDVTYWSTSEVYGSLPNRSCVIQPGMPCHFIDHPRRLYSEVKHSAEISWKMLSWKHPELVCMAKAVRPFNIYGPGQRRGVAWSMVRSALLEHEIRFADDTTRTMTGLKLASKISADAVLRGRSSIVDVVDPRCSLTMEALAHVVADALGANVELKRMPPDRLVRWRHVSEPDADVGLAAEVMHDELLELAADVERSIISHG